MRGRNDRFRLEATGTQASGLSGTRPWTALDASARWASALGIARSSWSARAGWNRVSEGAPLGTWPIAGTNFDWAIPLRAHPATRGGLIDPRSTGRRIAHAGVTADRPVRRFGLLMVGAGVFIDGAGIMNPAARRRQTAGCSMPVRDFGSAWATAARACSASIGHAASPTAGWRSRLAFSESGRPSNRRGCRLYAAYCLAAASCSVLAYQVAASCWQQSSTRHRSMQPITTTRPGTRASECRGSRPARVPRRNATRESAARSPTPGFARPRARRDRQG